MKRKISLLLSLVLMLSVMLTVLTALTSCREKQAPVYRGMRFGNSGVSSLQSAQDSVGIAVPLNSTTCYGEYSGDYVGGNPLIDDDAQLSQLKKALERRFLGIGSNGIYISPEQPSIEDVFSFSGRLYIDIDNPDNFEIVSFTLNGEECSSDMFEEGSSMQTIIVEPKFIATVTGFIGWFEIGDIKYRDGDELKDVVIGGDTILGTGEKKWPPVATVSDLNIANNTLSLNVNMNNSPLTRPNEKEDLSATVLHKVGGIRVMLYDGKSVTVSKKLVSGDNAITLEGLTPNTFYQCAVSGYYSAESGEIAEAQILYRYTFYTDPVVLFDNVTIEKDSISFTYLWDDDHQTKEISSLTLYKDGEPVTDIDPAQTSVTNLISGTTYKLVAGYQVGDASYSIYLEFTTLAES